MGTTEEDFTQVEMRLTVSASIGHRSHRKLMRLTGQKRAYCPMQPGLQMLVSNAMLLLTKWSKLWAQLALLLGTTKSRDLTLSASILNGQAPEDHWLHVP